jgi:hypothetical protein
MAKKNEKKQEQPTYVDELLKDGTTVLTAKTCEELAELVDKIPADCSYGAGAVGRNPETGMFTLRLDTLKD